MEETAKLWVVSHLDGLRLLRANFVKYAFKRHAHDYFVIGLIEAGLQKFSYQRDQYITPPSGLIVINPGEPHTGEAAVESGFHYRALYPEADQLQQIATEIKGSFRDIPFFTSPVILDAALYQEFRDFHAASEASTSTLEIEGRYLSALNQLVTKYADTRSVEKKLRRERHEIKRVCRYIEENYAEDIRLGDLANLVNWSPYHLLRVFHHETGFPPHAFLESVRVRQAQALLKAGQPIVEVAYATGFNSQSHFTTTFKRLISVTPGQYAKEVNF